MTKRKFEVTLYYSSLCRHIVEADSVDYAILKARELQVSADDIVDNLDSWEDADEAREINEDEDY